MDEHAETSRAGDPVSYQDGAVVSRITLKRETGNVTLFAFDTGQELSEHTTPLIVVGPVPPSRAAKPGSSNRGNWPLRR